MRRKISFVLALSLICMTLSGISFLPAEAASSNLLSNPSFELKRHNQSYPTGWEWAEPANSVVKCSDADRATGAYSGQAYSGLVGNWVYFYQVVGNILPGQSFSAGVWVNAYGVAGSGAFISMDYWGSGPSSLGYYQSQSITGTSGWTYVSFTTTAPAGADRVVFSLVLNGSGDVFFDDAALTRIPGNLAANSGFELGSAAPSYWDAWNPAGTVLQRQTNPVLVRSGGASAQVYASVGGEYPGYSQEITGFQVGKTYTASVWALTGGVSGFGGYIALSFWDGGTKILDVTGQNTGPGSSGVWQPLTVTGQAPAGATKMMLHIALNGTGDVYFDDATVDEAITLVDNASFDVAGSPIALWTPVNPGSCSFVRDTGVYRTWPASAKIIIPSQDAAGYPHYAQTLYGVVPGEEYTATAYVQTSGGAMAGVSLNWLGVVPKASWYGYDAVERISVSASPLGGGSGWTQVSVTAVAPNGCDRLVLAIVGTGQGDAYFDDVTLAKTSPRYEGTTATLSINPGAVINDNFYGFGSHGDYHLTCPNNADPSNWWLNTGGSPGSIGSGDGAFAIDAGDIALWQVKTAAIRPQIMRLFFSLAWWELSKGDYDYALTTPEMKDFVDWIAFLKSIGTDVLICPWGDWWAYPSFMWSNVYGYYDANGEWVAKGDRLPILSERDHMLDSLVELVDFLINTKGLTNVKFFTLMNEPACDPELMATDYEVWYYSQLLESKMSAAGLDLMHIGIDDCYHPPQGGGAQTTYGAGYQLDRIVDMGIGWADAVSVHTYVHDNTAWLEPFFKYDQDYLAAKGYGDRPIWVTEFGQSISGKLSSSANGQYSYGMWMADFAIQSLKNKVSAVLSFYFADMFVDYTGTRTEWGLWKDKEFGFVNRPEYYAWSLINHYTKANSQVVAVGVSDNASYKLDSVALISPTGEMTVFVINKSGAAMTATIQPNLPRSGVFSSYVYTQSNVPTNCSTAALIPASGTSTVAPYGSSVQVIPANSFLVFTEVS